ncbi:DUF58 domain-containing protein [Streptomyces sp. MS2A]|nr:DUF58 domain-containing protein [Streptomyces sp. MS2A]
MTGLRRGPRTARGASPDPAESSGPAERVTVRVPLRWRQTPVVPLGIIGAVLLAAVGLAASRVDVVALSTPLALAAAWGQWRRPAAGRIDVGISARAADAAEVHVAVDVRADAEAVQFAVDQDGRRSGTVDVAPGTGVLRSRSRLSHSGPIELLRLTARAVTADGAWVSEVVPAGSLTWKAAPRTRRLDRLPTSVRLTGLHGAHEGSRIGQGGEFRDIHPFAPGDELRRVDWRATARAARRPGDLLVRRTQALSDSAVVIAMDTADDLGAVVASWGTPDRERSGVTSLDLAREAALSLATCAVETGDRVAFHVLAPGGRAVRSGSGARHLARLRGVIAGTGASGDGSRFRRTPPIGSGSIVFVLSTFFDGAAAEIATRWRAGGHAVVAVDVLPEPDTARLTAEQTVAVRTLLAERQDVMADLRGAGVEVVAWNDDGADAALRAVAAHGRAGAGRGRR